MSNTSNLKRLRMFFGLTQQDMAELIKVDKRTYINKENGDTPFKSNEMYLIKNRFGLSADKIFFDENFEITEVLESDTTCKR
ncbi:helix-turn-helix transcriptional regulator [Lederbergia citrisecunda]|uniref:helix-turn-helix transcriptional regulator n=1 Tax=Lederbergia citrisecunda TaxID=2833583 RepID=UPI0032E7FC23